MAVWQPRLDQVAAGTVVSPVVPAHDAGALELVDVANPFWQCGQVGFVRELERSVGDGQCQCCSNDMECVVQHWLALGQPLDQLAETVAEVRRVRADEDFSSRAMRLIERDKELLERLAK